MSEYAVRKNVIFDVLLKVDCGNHRCGVDPRKEDSLKLAGYLASLPGLRFRGVLAHAGHAYHCESRDQVKVVARMERAKTVGFAHRLRQSGIPVEIVSVGSTPTMSVVDSLAGVTEIRPGNYVFYDVFQAALGCCTRDRIALSVLSTVIGVYPQRDTFVIDAGALALSMDQSVRGMDPDGGFGEVETPRHGHRFPVLSLSQEHGIVGGLCRAGVHPGTMVRVFPNHACLTAAQFDRYVVLKGGVKRGLWRIIKGWNRRK
jgi:D-serine deaminase-like pyridoxal phosphate-dependent protein